MLLIGRWTLLSDGVGVLDTRPFWYRLQAYISHHLREIYPGKIEEDIKSKQ